MLNAKSKNVDNYTWTQLKAGIRTFYSIQKKKWDQFKNSQAVKTGVALKSLGQKVVKLKVAAKKWPQSC